MGIARNVQLQKCQANDSPEHLGALYMVAGTIQMKASSMETFVIHVGLSR
jgi:hypothetical protein